MDFLLLIQPFDKAVGYKGKGDFEIDSSGKLSRPENLDHYKYMFAGLTLLKPDIITSKSGSLKEYYFNNPNVYGTLLEDMNWYHATRPEDIKEIETSLSTSVGELS
jgi:MurNAc alpha-1-phosphate uridylyltransferase